MAGLGNISSAISSIFSSLLPKKAFAGDKYVFWQQSGCFARIYHQDGRTTDLYFEIDSCQVDRTLTDVGGSFSMTLIPNKPWDELIQPDDFIRIFMGDQVIAANGSPAAFNVASGDISMKSKILPLPNLFSSGSALKIPLSGTGPLVRGGKTVNGSSDRDAPPQLVMYERMFGKIDRCERIKSAPSKSGGSSVQFMVSGRGFGSILQDLVLYYNEHVPGLNAINVWYNSLIKAQEQAPDEIVKEFLAVILSVVPFPQWQLPPQLTADFFLPNISAENLAVAAKTLGQAAARITEQAASNPALGLGAATTLQKLVESAANSPEKSPIALISLKGIKKTHGRMMNQSFMNDSSSGVFDKVKYLSNAPFNEFFCDLCPNGDPEGGNAASAPLLPTFVMRQRPYNIVEDMLKNTSQIYGPHIKNLELFPPSEDTPGQSLLDLLPQGFTVIGAVQDPEAIQALISDNLEAISSGEIYFRPTLLEYQVGISGHDRQNAFQVLASYPTGQASHGGDRAIMAANGGFKMDADSITKFGFRILEFSTPYATPASTKSQDGDHTKIMKEFTDLIANWYFLNPAFLNGRLVCRFLPEARLGVPVRYVETQIRPDNPYPKLELSYCQGVSDRYKRGQVLTTSVTTTRGIRYKLEDAGIDVSIGKAINSGISSMLEAIV